MDAAYRIVRTPPEPARLTLAQKRDLLGIAASALVTTALIAAPLIIADAPAPTLMASRIEVPGQATIVAPDPVLLLRPADAAPAAPQRRRPSVIRASTFIGPSTDIQAAPDEAKLTAPRKPLTRRLTGLFTGDGTYAVRPFPTISAERH